MTLEELRAEREAARQRWAAARYAAASAAKEVALFDSLISLQSEGERSRMRGKMPELEKRKNAKISETMSRAPSVAKARLIAANKTPADVARELKVTRQTVQAWLSGQNAIPRAARDYLRTTYQIPDSAWARSQDT